MGLDEAIEKSSDTDTLRDWAIGKIVVAIDNVGSLEAPFYTTTKNEFSHIERPSPPQGEREKDNV